MVMEEAKIKPIIQEELRNYIRKLNNRSTPGLDGINHKTLKVGNIKHTDLFVHLFNACMAWSVYPDNWKIGRLVPIPKNKGNPHCPTSYCPLTLLSTLFNLLERCLTKQIREIAEPLLSSSQYGFRKGLSSEDCVVC